MMLELIYPNEYNKFVGIFKDKIDTKSYIPRFSIPIEISTQSYKNLLLLKTNLSFKDVINNLIEKYSLDIPKEDPYKEMQEYLYSLQMQKCFNKPLNEIVTRYNHKEVDFNIKIRVELYKEGWNPTQIENYMYKHVLKTPFNYTLNLEYYNILINNILLKLNISRKEGFMKVGRPPLPLTIKNISKERHLKITKDNMRKKYTYTSSYEKILPFLFTKEEVNEFEKVVKDKNLVDKIKMLSLNDN